MRQGQQKRMRGRNRGNGGGKGPNNLNRTFESNGPDVKVRGTAAHIAEKYVQLARDAQSSGDPILAEAYLQHAEHYFRVIAAAQPQFNGQPSFNQPAEDEDEGEDFEFDGPIPSMPQPAYQSQGGPQGSPQPGGEGGGERFPPQQGRDRNYNDRPHFNDRHDGDRQQGGFRRDRDRFQNDRYQQNDRPRHDRPYNEGGGYRSDEGGEGERGFSRHNRRDNRYGDRPYQDRQQGERPYQERQGFQPQPVVPVDQPQPDIADDAALSALPSFITGPGPAAPAGPATEGEGEARFPLRSRRRRAPKRSGDEGEAPQPETGVEPVGE
jgi:hypothetical protein